MTHISWILGFFGQNWHFGRSRRSRRGCFTSTPPGPSPGGGGAVSGPRGTRSPDPGSGGFRRPPRGLGPPGTSRERTLPRLGRAGDQPGTSRYPGTGSRTSARAGFYINPSRRGPVPGPGPGRGSGVAPDPGARPGSPREAQIPRIWGFPESPAGPGPCAWRGGGDPHRGREGAPPPLLPGRPVASGRPSGPPVLH